MSDQEKIKENSQNKLELFYSVCSWLFGVLLMLMSLIMLSSSSLTALILLIAGLYLLPPINKKIASRAEFKITPLISIAVVVVLFIASLLATNSPSKPQKKEIYSSTSMPPKNDNPVTSSPKEVEATLKTEPKKETTEVKTEPPKPKPEISKMSEEELNKFDTNKVMLLESKL